MVQWSNIKNQKEIFYKNLDLVSCGQWSKILVEKMKGNI